MYAHGAQFAEVRVDADTGEIRVPRMTGVFAVGRVLNAKTARSQLLGGMAWGVSMALLEESVLDPRYGDFVNADLAEYHVAVNADVGEIDVDLDRRGRPLRQPDGRQGRRRDRDRGRRGRGRERRAPRDRGAGARPADHARQAARPVLGRAAALARREKR